eukprot:scaffold8637_cov127-Isochrysis_galbana.AAC.8
MGAACPASAATRRERGAGRRALCVRDTMRSVGPPPAHTRGRHPHAPPTTSAGGRRIPPAAEADGRRKAWHVGSCRTAMRLNPPTRLHGARGRHPAARLPGAPRLHPAPGLAGEEAPGCCSLARAEPHALGGNHVDEIGRKGLALERAPPARCCPSVQLRAKAALEARQKRSRQVVGALAGETRLHRRHQQQATRLAPEIAQDGVANAMLQGGGLFAVLVHVRRIEMQCKEHCAEPHVVMTCGRRWPIRRAEALREVHGARVSVHHQVAVQPHRIVKMRKRAQELLRLFAPTPRRGDARE